MKNMLNNKSMWIVEKNFFFKLDDFEHVIDIKVYPKY